MKKILFLCLLTILATAFISPQLQAQTPVNLISTGNSLATDTVTNAGVKTLISPTLGYATSITIQVDITKISGTLGGSLTAVVSNDGITYYAIGSAYTVTDVASQGTTFTPTLGFRYYGVRWTGTGTMSGSFKAKLVTRKP